MNESETQTEAHATPLPEGVASPMPDSFFCALWVPAFFATVWGMMVLFGVKPGVNYDRVD